MKPTGVSAGVRRALSGRRVPSAGQTVVAALSGGADSVALLDALVEEGRSRGIHVVAAHLDHRLRPDSAEDARFCVALCARLDVPLRVGEADVRGRAAREKGGLEEAARKERYVFLRTVKKEEKAVAIAVAHTLDDQAETVLLRLLRGAGRTGLGGMRPRSRDLIRPLLGVTRREVIGHLRARRLPWREDPTNADATLARNRVRQELLPYLEARFNPEVRRALARTAEVLRDESRLLGALVREVGLVADERNGEAVLSRAKLRAAPRALGRLAVRRALRAAGNLRNVGHAHVERILDLAISPVSGRRLALPRGREAVFEFDELRLAGRRPAAAAFARPLPVPGRVELPNGRAVVAEADPGPAGGDGQSAVVPTPRGELVVRTRRPGDRVRSGRLKKSLKRFLMERRVPASRRAELPLVAAGHEVLWVPGQKPPGARADEGGGYVRLRIEEGATGGRRA